MKETFDQPIPGITSHAEARTRDEPRERLRRRLFTFHLNCKYHPWGLINDMQISIFIIHQTHYEKSDWSRAFNQCTIACELDMINAISAADIALIMSSSTSAWLPSPLECSPQKQNG